MVCACCASRITKAVGADTVFLCSTIDPELGATLEIVDFGTNAVELDFEGNSVPADLEITDYGSAFSNFRWRPADGLTPDSDIITLGVSFVGGTKAEHEFVQEAAVDWIIGDPTLPLQFQFGVSADQSQIRIDFVPSDGNRSEIGNLARLVPLTLPTMNLAEVTRRSVHHEFGHALGLLHEHAHPASGIQWNEQAVIDELSSKWSEKEVRTQILKKFPKGASCVGDPAFNTESIMLYPIPARWTLDGFSTELNIEISDRDRRCLRGLYASAR